MAVDVVRHSPAWRLQFERVAGSLRVALRRVRSAAVEQVGSTAVPAVKLALASDPAMDIDTYVARKSAVLQKVLAESDLTAAERRQILRLNDSLA